jgi:uncharacterized membrane protein
MELLALIALVLAGFAFVKATDAERRLNQVQRMLRDMSHQIAQLGGDLKTAPSDTGPAEPAAAAERQTPDAEAAPTTEAPRAPAPEPTPVLAQVSATSGHEPGAGAAPSPPGSDAKTIEEALTSRWLVWLGAVAIALAGTFFVKYAIDNGYLGPAARVTLGFLLGVALAIAGEWLRRRPLQRAIAAIRTNHVPPALTAAGLFTAFASIYAAYGLYDLLSPLVAFVGLAMVALLAVGLSLLQGPFVALMGLLGAFLTPALIGSPNPSAWGLFAYLLIVEAGCLAVARYRSWWQFALWTLAGVLLWPLIWMVTNGTPSDALPIGIHLLVSAAGYVALQHGRDRPEAREDWFEEIQRFSIAEWIVWGAACAAMFVLYLVVRWADYNAVSLVFVGLMSALYIFVGRREQILDGFAAVAGVITLAVAATMPLPANVSLPPALPGAPLIPPELQYFAGFNLAVAALFGVSGFVALWGARRPALWAAVSALVPILLLINAYDRIAEFGVDPAWALLALILAAASLYAAERVNRYRAARGLEVTLGIYAAAVVALISLAAAMTVRQAWLTVALSLQLPALAWINTRINTRSIQLIAAVVASAVLTRLVLNYNIFDYPLADNPVTSWVVYGYGVPAIAFFFAARVFRKLDAEALVGLLEAGALAFFVLLISFQIRLLVAGSLDATDYGLLEQSLQSIAWFSIGAALAIYHRRKNHRVAFAGSLLLLGVAAAQVFLLHLLASNPVVTHDPVGAYPVLNVLFLAYAIPAAFAFCVASAVSSTEHAAIAPYAAVAGFLLVFVYLTLEVMRAFQGPSLSTLRTSDAEVYTYSMVWLAYALTLLGLGIAYGQSLLRYASLAVLVITAAKVFLFDMAGLTGLFRVASFLGLGLSLVGIGYLYQRFVFHDPGAKRTAQPAPP